MTAPLAAGVTPGILIGQGGFGVSAGDVYAQSRVNAGVTLAEIDTRPRWSRQAVTTGTMRRGEAAASPSAGGGNQKALYPLGVPRPEGPS